MPAKRKGVDVIAGRNPRGLHLLDQTWTVTGPCCRDGQTPHLWGSDTLAQGPASLGGPALPLQGCEVINRLVYGCFHLDTSCC